MSEASGSGTAEGSGYQFGTFKGVFTPSILTILGVIMYLRFGWALGSIGLLPVLLIVTLSSGITFATGLSLSALATNRKVEGGGAYHIISRSLGAEAGTAVGVPLFFAQALGIAFYIAGFSESVVAAFPGLVPAVATSLQLGEHVTEQLVSQAPIAVGLSVLLVLTGIAYISADLALRTQYAVMAAITISLIAFFAGGTPDAAPDMAKALPAEPYFWAVFAVIFPAVTGIEAGIAMSGDLKNPAKALPRGTLAAVLTGYAVYVALCLFLWFSISDKTHLLHPMIAGHVARWKTPVLVGVWAASLSSAMGALLGAPRTLQALARDRIVPPVLGRGYGAGNDPRLATAVAAIVAGAGLMLGNLNLIAPILSMFFLTSYGLLNASAGIEELVNIPSWRPTFRVPWWISIGAAGGCFAVMFMLDAGATFAAIVIAGILYTLTKRRNLKARWGDVRSAIYTFLALQSMRALNRRKADERTWQPNLLVLSGSPASRWYLIELAQAIARDRGFMTVATVVPEDTPPERLNGIAQAVREYLGKREVEAFVKLVSASDPFTGAGLLAGNYGYGPIRPNTILLGETENPESYPAFARLVQLACRQHQNLVVVRESDDGADRADTPHKRVDLWWYGDQRNLGLMLALVFLLRRGHEWRRTELIIKTLVATPDEQPAAHERLESFIDKVRIRARAEILVREAGNVFEDIRAYSQGADLVCMGIRPPADDEPIERYSRYYGELLNRTAGLPLLALVLAAEEMDYYAIFDDE